MEQSGSGMCRISGPSGDRFGGTRAPSTGSRSDPMQPSSPAATTAPSASGTGSSGPTSTTLETEVCSLVVGNFSQAEWQELAPGLPERTTCPT